jgi:3'-phosphoadenosine 5'-phosphosulfate sulfotransferase (PAPS reductase)/FAD synthetase
MSSYHLTHLKQLEAESIHIIREVAAEFKKPVMLYSVGKDSAVMTHLASQGILSSQASVSFSPCGHHLEVQGDDQVPRQLR